MILQHWQRPDGYDDRDPSAPSMNRCQGCDAFRSEDSGYCSDCGEVTNSYLWTRQDALNEYLSSRVMGFVREPHTGLIHLNEPARRVA